MRTQLLRLARPRKESKTHLSTVSPRIKFAHQKKLSTVSALYSSTSKVNLPPRPTLPNADLKHVYLKGSGPGGQKINKTSSAVQLTHLPTGIVVKSQATRSRSQNHNIARRILAEKIELIEKGTESRAAKVIEHKQKKKRSSGKKARRKYRKLMDDGNSDGVGVGTTTGIAGAVTGAEVGTRLQVAGTEVPRDCDELLEDEEEMKDTTDGTELEEFAAGSDAPNENVAREPESEDQFSIPSDSNHPVQAATAEEAKTNDK